MKKRNNTHNLGCRAFFATSGQMGRSMVEMLGVLAIIGVLSVGGIYGYTVAMRKYRANEIVQAASMLAIMQQSANAGEGECIQLSRSGLSSTVGGVNVDMVADEDPTIPGGSNIKIQIEDLEEAEITTLCNLIENTAEGNRAYTIDSCGSDLVSCDE
ncbi:MAG: Tfp pilus assembly protein FimT/FimU [Alphaproteobacteria bacterium]